MATPLPKKLRLHTIQKALILNAPQGYLDLLGDLPEGMKVYQKAEGKFEFVHLFVKDRAEYQDLAPIALEAVEYDGLLWISYPKKSAKIKSDLSRDILWDMTKGTGIRPVTQISIDETWSALRFRPDEEVKS